MSIRYVAPFGVRTGYSQAAQDNISALLHAGGKVDIVPLNEGSHDDLEPRYQHLLEHVGQDLDDVTHHVVHTVPKHAHLFASGDYDPGEGVKKVCYTTWETDRLPVAIVDSLVETFDRIIVPSIWNAHVMRQSGVPAGKVAVVPHTYDATFWAHAGDARWTPGWTPTGPVRFYTIGVWGARKNLMGTLLAYWHAFSDPSYDVTLRVLCPKPAEGEIEALIERCALDHYAPVEFITDPMTDLELRELHRSSDVFISATRGEAWGLGAFEAAITGNPVVMPGFGGQRDFLRLLAGRWRLVPHQLTPVAPENFTTHVAHIAGIPVRSITRGAPSGLTAQQLWAEPDLHEMAALMREATDAIHGRHMPAESVDLSSFAYETIGPRFLNTILEV